jgi:hypothetical protein
MVKWIDALSSSPRFSTINPVVKKAYEKGIYVYVGPRTHRRKYRMSSCW